MTMRAHLLAVFAVLLLAMSASGLAFAQSEGPNPNNPVQDRTPTPSQDEKSTRPAPDEDEPDPTETAEGTPEAKVEVPLTGNSLLAAMTLDSETIPEEFTLLFENFTTPEELADNLAGQVDREALLATGIEMYYESYYINNDGNTIRTYIIAFESIQGVRAGFNLLEDEELLVPNGSMIDLPALEGVGEPPGEITSGSRENGDGTQTNSYDISYRVNRFEVGVAMETYDESEPDSDLIDQLARDLADRCADALAGNPVSGVDGSLSELVLLLDGRISIEGFETAVETFQLTDPDDAPDGYIAGYYRGASYSDFVLEILPFASVAAARFESADDVEAALQLPEAIMPSVRDLEDLAGVEIEGADDLVAFSFSSSGEATERDSVRIFLQLDDLMLIIDVEGLETVDDAEQAATDLADALIVCVLDGECDDPGVLGAPETESLSGSRRF